MSWFRTLRGTTISLAAVVLAAQPVLALGPLDDSGHFDATLAPAGSVHAGLAAARTTIESGDGPSRVALTPGVSQLILDGVPADTTVRLRSRNEGRWSDWIEVTAEADEAPDAAPTTGPIGVGPIWVGHDADAVEIDLPDRQIGPVLVEGLAPAHAPTVQFAAASQTDGTTTSTTSSTTSTSTTTSTTPTTAVPDESGATGSEAAGEEAVTVAFHPRADWALDGMGWACNSAPKSAGEVRAAVVHHTAGTTEYLVEDVPDVIRGIWRYHVQTRGWCDIGYNFVVDRYGGVWEARQGGIDRAVIGGHTRGFNTGTTGIAQLGNFETHETPVGANEALDWLLGWKLAAHGIDPDGTTTLVNRTGSDFRGVPDGDDVPTATVVGHRDLGSTSCPGEYTYADLASRRLEPALGIHVAALHRTFLQAFPTPDDYGDWLAIAESEGTKTVALQMAFSEEYAGLIVDDLYERVLHRSPEPEGRAYWLEQMAAGMRVEDVGVLFYGSQEYVDRAGDWATYVTRLYRNLLHREPEDDGLSFWSKVLEVEAMSAPEVAQGFYQSLESRRDRVARLYTTILGRGPDASGWEHWAELLIDTDDVLLAVELSVSDEFYERAIR